VAIKIVAKESTNAREMFCELEVQAKLNHDNVVRFFEIFDEADSFYVVMELYVASFHNVSQ
jgi:serine/threonine protein kinase